jgi:hypothetical protein
LAGGFAAAIAASRCFSKSSMEACLRSSSTFCSEEKLAEAVGLLLFRYDFYFTRGIERALIQSARP